MVVGAVVDDGAMGSNGPETGSGSVGGAGVPLSRFAAVAAVALV